MTFQGYDLEDIDADTGDNDANDNTGSVEGSDPAIDTGDAKVVADVANVVNDNAAGLGVELDFGWDLNDLFDMLGL